MPLLLQSTQLPPVTFEHRGVDLVIVGSLRAMELKRNLERAAANLLPHDVLDLGLERAIAFAALDRQLEISAVDRAHLDADCQTVVLVMSFAKAGHAQ